MAKLGWRQPGGPGGFDPPQRLPGRPRHAVLEGGTVVEAPLQPVHQLRHRRASHASRPAVGQQREQLPGIPAWAGNVSCSVSAHCTASWCWPAVSARCRSWRNWLRRCSRSSSWPWRSPTTRWISRCSCGLCATGPDTGRAGPGNAGHAGAGRRTGSRQSRAAG